MTEENFEKELKRIEKKMSDFEIEIKFSVKKEEDINTIIDVLLIDFPLTFHIDSIQYSYDCQTKVATLKPHYNMSKLTYDMLINKSLLKLNSIKKYIDMFKDDYLKEQWIHDYICGNVVYKEGQYAHCFIGPLLYGAGVCQGIALFSKLLLNLAKIKNHVISGIARDDDGTLIPHCWNSVCLNNKSWTLCDFTYDVCCSTDNMLRHDFFNVMSYELEKTHFPTRTNNMYHNLTTNHECYFNYHKILFFNKKETLSYIDSFFLRRQNIIYFKLLMNIDDHLRKTINNYIKRKYSLSSFICKNNDEMNIFYYEISYK